MFDYADATAFANLERFLAKLLMGEDGGGGLYQGILACPNWEHYQLTKGMIIAYENVRKEMKQIAADMDKDSDNRQQRRFERIN